MKKISTYKIHELRLRQNPQIKAWMDRQWFKIKCGARRMWEKLKAKFSKN